MGRRACCGRQFDAISLVPGGVCGSATALMAAAAAGHIGIMAALLAADADVDATNDYGCRRARARTRADAALPEPGLRKTRHRLQGHGAGFGTPRRQGRGVCRRCAQGAADQKRFERRAAHANAHWEPGTGSSLSHKPHAGWRRRRMRRLHGRRCSGARCSARRRRCVYAQFSSAHREWHAHYPSDHSRSMLQRMGMIAQEALASAVAASAQRTAHPSSCAAMRSPDYGRSCTVVRVCSGSRC